MINWMKIENYKGFERLDLDDVARITLIGGRNNTGKTSLLEAMFLFYDTADPGMFFRHLGWRGIEVTSANADTLIAPAFRDFNTEHHIKLVVSDGIYKGEMDVSFNPAHIHKSISVDLLDANTIVPQVRTDQIPLTSYALNIRYDLDSNGKHDVSLVVKQNPTNLNIQFEPGPVNFPVGMVHSVILLPLRLKVDPGEDALRFGKLDVDKKIDTVLEFLRVLEPNLVGLSAIPLATTLPLLQKSVVYADIGLSRKIPIAYMGDGMSRLLSLILAIATAKNGIVLVDEIDAGIHHSIMPKVWEGVCKAAKEFNCQIFATTHSYECLQSAYDGTARAGIPHEFRYVRLDRTEDGIVAKNYSHDVLGAALEQGWEVR